MHATTSAQLARPSLGGMTFKLPRGSETGSRGDHGASSERRWNNNNCTNSSGSRSLQLLSKSASSSRDSTDQILNYYYYESSAEAAPDETSSSNDDDDLSTTALQGHQRSTSANTHALMNEPALNKRSSSVNSSSSGTIIFPAQRTDAIVGTTMATPPVTSGGSSTSTSTSTSNLLSARTSDSRRYSFQHTDSFTNNKSIFRRDTVSAAHGVTGVVSSTPAITIKPHSSPVAVDDVPASAPAIQRAFAIPFPEAAPSIHHRSASDVPSKQHQHKRGRSSRDIGIVGTIGTGSVPTPLHSSNHVPEAVDPDTARLTLPLFQTPRSRSPSPSSFVPSTTTTTHTAVAVAAATYSSSRYDGTMALSDHSDVDDTPTKTPSNNPKQSHPDTPRNSIERERERDKQRHSYSARLAFKPAQPPSLSYLYYQPGLHATAGPLPSPPRRIYTPNLANPPPRPPRLNPQSRPASSERPQSQILSDPEAASSQLQLSTPSTSSDYSITAVSVLTSDSNEQPPPNSPPKSNLPRVPMSSQTDESTSGTDKSFHTSNHTREGAFGISIDQPTIMSSDINEFKKDIHAHNSNRAKVESSPASDPDPVQSKRKMSSSSLRSSTPDPDPDVTSLPSSPSSYGSSSEAQIKLHSLPPPLKRTSTPSLSPPSPPPPPLPPLPPSLLPEPVVDTFYQPVIDLSNKLPTISLTQYDSKKSPSDWPDAMNFKDILAIKSSKERALAYSIKFRELMLEETGLRGWLNGVVKKDRNERGVNISVSLTPANPPSHDKQVRHVSRGSVASEATFPIRGDAYTATDLMSKPVADMPSMTAPPSLPYPSLAQGIGIRKRSSNNFSVTEIPLVSPAAGAGGSAATARTLGGGFFASIGRKASLRKDRTLQPLSLSPGKHPANFLLQPPQPPQSRVIKLEHAPTLPGGPRAPPRSAHRASTIVYSRKTEDSTTSLLSKRHSVSPARRSEESSSTSASFDRRLGMMVDLLPQADKDVLSAYLRRAQNSDPMVAISNYLEDAKQNDIRVS